MTRRAYLLALDHALWGLEPVGYRVHGLLWFLLLVAALGGVLHLALPRRLATLSFVVFAISGVHASLFWTATRHIVIAAAIGTLALLVHLRWRERGWRAGCWPARCWPRSHFPDLPSARAV